MPRPAALLLAIALALAVLTAGCGSSSDDGSSAPAPPSSPGAGAPAGAAATDCDAEAEDAGALRATGLPCSLARRVLFDWQRRPACALPAAASRGSCLSRSYRCQSVRTDRGLAVSCTRPGESVAFVAQRR